MLRKRISQSKNGGNLPELARKELLQESLQKKKMNLYFFQAFRSTSSVDDRPSRRSPDSFQKPRDGISSAKDPYIPKALMLRS